MAIWDVITKPVRGVGRLLRGKFREGLGDIGSAAKTAAPLLHAIPGVGTGLAMGIGAAGGALEAGLDKNPRTNWLKSAAGGATRAGAGALASRYLGGGAGGGGGGAGSSATELIPGTPEFAGAGAGGGGVTGALSRAGSRAGDAVRSVGGFVEKHPTLVGSGLEAFGQYQEGKAIERATQVEEDELRRRTSRQENLDPVLAQIIAQLVGQQRTAY